MYPRNVRTLVDALRAKLGANVSYVPTEWLQSDSGANAGVALARNADVIVVALAEPAEAEKAGDIDDLALPDSQLRLVQLMQRTGKPVVVTLFEARPRTIHAIVGASRAIVLALEPGPYGGEALASVLTGDVNPSGRLPFTYPRNSADIEHYDHAASADALWNAPTGGYTPEWDFGAGLSYTTFNYSALTLDRPSYSRTDTIRAVVTVHNAGARQGMDVIQVYSRQFYASVAPAVRKLRAFEKVSLAPGETRMIKLDIPVSRLAIVGRNDRASVEPGEFELQSGGLSAKFTVR
jgi:beta-glucosidase